MGTTSNAPGGPLVEVNSSQRGDRRKSINRFLTQFDKFVSRTRLDGFDILAVNEQKTFSIFLHSDGWGPSALLVMSNIE